MKSPIRFAFIMAVPIEAASIYLKGNASDIRFSAGGISLERVISQQYEFVHWPGLYLSDWFSSVGFPRVGDLAVLACGYLDTVLLLLTCFIVLGSLRRRGRGHAPTPDEPAES
ncbi:MAG: hypothetical protein ABR905_04670 [Terracidiphilus sp.]|jgi:hypothetical protein